MSRTTKLLTAASAAVAVMLFATVHAGANGRFPASVSVNTQPGNDQVILVGATWGAFLSTDDGDTFKWICEQAIGYGGTFDPKYRIDANGTLFATTFEGLRRSTDGGCTWETVEGPLLNHWVDFVEVASNGDVWVTTSSGGMANDVFRSTDGGATFQSRNLLHPTAWWKSVQIAPSDTDRIYVSGYLVAQSSPDGGLNAPAALIYTSDDGGDSWTELDIGMFALNPNMPQVIFSGVLPSNPNVVYARAVTANAPIGDALYRSVDAGTSWTKIFDSDDTIVAFEIRQDGSLFAGTVNSGVFYSTNEGDTWNPTQQQPQMACIQERAGGGDMFACGSNWDPDFFAVGRSPDGQTWSKLVRFSDVKAPLECPAGTIQRDTCQAILWPSMCEMFGCNGDAGPTDGDGGNANNDGGPGTGGPGGCCSTGTGAPESLLLGAFVAFLLMRRRQSRQLGSAPSSSIR